MGELLVEALRLRNAGMLPIPVVARGKRPIPSDWPNYDPTDDALRRDLRDGAANLGVLLGPRSGDLVDIDLDAPCARALARRFLPATEWVAGRRGAPASHHFFRSMDGKTRRFRDPSDGACLVELRAGGAQTVVPPSCHPSGERYEWQSKNNLPAEVPADALEAAAARLAAASLLAKHHPDPGGRHDATLALSGMLLRAGWEQPDVNSFVGAVAEAAGDEEASARARNCESTQEKLRRGSPVRGAPHLATIIAEPVVRKAAEWLGIPWANGQCAATEEQPPPEHAPPEQLLDRRGTPHLVTVADVEPEDVSWLWHPYIPLRKLTLLMGDPGLGKTWLALAIAAGVSKGEFGTEPSGADVIFLTAEDGIADTLRPRLESLGADLVRVHILDHIRESNGKERPVSLADVEMIESAVSERSAALLVIDPVQGFLGPGVDFHKANDIRPLLAALARMAERQNCAVVPIGHLRKAEAVKVIHRALGSVDFIAAARSALLVAQHPEDVDSRVLAHAKSNLAQMGPSLAFAIEDGVFSWQGEVDLHAEEIALAAPKGSRPKKLDEAAAFLRELLRDGPKAQPWLKADAEKRGLAWHTVERAKKQLGVVSRKPKGTPNSSWVWELP